MDIIDEANERAEYFTAKAIEQAREGLRPRLLREPEPECVDCGEEIPAARRKALPGCPRCVSCQQRWEAGEQ